MTNQEYKKAIEESDVADQKDIILSEYPLKFDAHISVEEIKRIHQKFWNYVIEIGYKPKTYYMNNCTLCSVAMLIYDEYARMTDSICDFCPAREMRHYNCADGINSLFHKWEFANDLEEKNKWAEAIRDVEINSLEEILNDCWE